MIWDNGPDWKITCLRWGGGIKEAAGQEFEKAKRKSQSKAWVSVGCSALTESASIKNLDLKIVVFSRMVFDPLKLDWFHPFCLPFVEICRYEA